MKERSEKTFEILEVLFRKEKVRLVFASSQLEISRQIYTDGFYYPGKKLSSKEMATLRKEAGLYKAEGYLARLLSTHRMTVRGCHDKLSRFPLSQTDREKLLSPYIEAGILDDRQYAIDFIQDRTEKGYGRTRILAELKKRGIHTEEILEDKEISDLFSNVIDEKLMQAMEKKLSEKPLLMKKKKMVDSLSRRGFPLSIAKEAVEEFFRERNRDDKKEQMLLKQEAEKCYNLLMRKTADPRKKEEAFWRRLLTKGFRSEDIRSVIEERRYTFK